MRAPLSRLLSILLLLGPIGLVGCQSLAVKREPVVDKEIEQALQANEAARTTVPLKPAVPPEVSNALLPPLSGASGGKLWGKPKAKAEEMRYDFSVQKVPAQEFFSGLVAGTPYNMAIHPEVSGSISLQLKNVTVPEVMDTVRDVYGYDFRQSRTGYQVMPIRLRSHIFHVDYLNVNRTGISHTSIRTGRQSDSDSDDESGAAGGDSAVGAQISTEQPTTTFWAELERSIRTIIGNADGRSVSVNPHSGLVVVRAMPQEIREVQRFLDATENTIARQVILEAKILEVTLNDGHQAGINWAFMQNRGDTGILGSQFPEGRAIDLTGPPDGQFIPWGMPILNDAGNAIVDPATGQILRSAGLATNPFGGIFSLAVQISDFAAFVELLKTQGDVHVLSSPRISTLNNQKAVIKVGSEEFFVTDVNTTTNSDGNNVGVDVELAQFFSGIALDVTPQVDGQGMVTLHIHPTVVTVQDQTKSFVVFGQDQVLPLAYSTSRESDSIVRAASGQVVVIGGLIRNNGVEDRQSVPGLGELPVLGALFRHEKQVMVKSELVILLRPVVVEGGQPWTDDLRRTRQRLRVIGDDRPSIWKQESTQTSEM